MKNKNTTTLKIDNRISSGQENTKWLIIIMFIILICLLLTGITSIGVEMLTGLNMTRLFYSMELLGLIVGFVLFLLVINTK